MLLRLTESFLRQAYDGHMNLILSDVEETIMIVDPVEGAPEGHTSVNVSLGSRPHRVFKMTHDPQGCKTQNGDALCQRRWCHTGTELSWTGGQTSSSHPIQWQVSPPSRT